MDAQPPFTDPKVEAAFQGIPGLTEIGVAEVEVKTDARLIIAFYTAPQALDEADLSRIAGERLARYKQPRAFVHIAEMPRNPNGKLLRKGLPALWPGRVAS